MRLFDSVQGLDRNVISVRPKRYHGEMSRVGVFPYIINGKLVWQYRPEDEVLDPRSVESLIDAVMTIDHPFDDSDVTHFHGSVINAYANPEKLAIEGDFVLLTEESETLAKRGSPLSPMYDADVLEEPGIYMGKPYDYTQRNIRYSSLGLVEEARQGNTVKVFYQLSKDSNGTVTTDAGITYNASIITPMKITKQVIRDSVAALETPVEAPVVPAIETVTSEVPAGISPDTLAQITGVTSPVDLVIDAADAGTPEPAEETVAADAVAVEEATETPAENPESVDVIAQITDVGGVMVDREFLSEVIDVAQDAVARGLMDLKDAVYYAQANIGSVKKNILESAGINLKESDDVHTAYRVFADVAAKQVSNTVTAPVVGERETIGDSLNRSPVKAPVRHQATQTRRPTVTHPTTSVSAPVTTQTKDSEYVSFDSIGL